MAIGNSVINISLFAHKVLFWDICGLCFRGFVWFGCVYADVCVQNSDAARSTLSGWQRLGTILTGSQGSVLGTPFDFDDFCTIKSHPCNCVIV